ncbi:MAG: adenylate/guanylate cyclase domain-containing protein [Cyanobacteriota bacterium]|nr:adenylate/guanylate cyclase domain-containing protein [Cyanobacteriota bacterium]
MSNLVPSDRMGHEPSILCSSIHNFSILQQSMTSDNQERFIESYWSRMESAITKQGGQLETFPGETLLARFDGGADKAVRAGIMMLRELNAYNRTRQTHNRLPIQIGIGIDTLAADKQRSQTQVKVRSRDRAASIATWLEQETRRYSASLLISHHAFWHLEDAANLALRLIDRVALPDKAECISIFEIFECDPRRLRDGKLATKQLFEQAILLYHLGKFDAAIDQLSNCLRRNQGDPLITIYLQRAQTAQLEARLR